MATSTAPPLNLISIVPNKQTHKFHAISATKNQSFTPLSIKSPRISPTTFSKTLFLTGSTLPTFNVDIKKPPVYATPAFLAGIETGSLNVPATHLAAGMAKWLDLYAHVLTVRILLGWFPTIRWDKQPLSAVRSLCDPYLNLFRNLVPSTGTLDFSSIIGFMVLATLSKILNTKQPF